MRLNEEEFDWNDFHKDTRALSLDARGAWWDCLFQMRLSPTRGRITMPLSGFATMFGTTPQKALKVIEEIRDIGVGDVDFDSVTKHNEIVTFLSGQKREGVTKHNRNITVTNRRMFRAFREREASKIRQSEYRDRIKTGQDNGEKPQHNANVTNDPKNALYVEEFKDKELKPKKKSPSVASTRIPDPFPLTDEMIEWARTNVPGLEIAFAHANFVEYWTNNTTAKAKKVNWRMTWEKGMKLARRWQDDKPNANNTKQHSPKSGTTNESAEDAAARIGVQGATFLN